MNNTVLHLSHDDKFIDLMIDEFEELSNFDNKYVIFTDPGVTSLKHVKSQKVEFAEKNSEEYHQLIGDINSYKAVFVHYLGKYLSEIVLKADKSTKIFAIFWGSEVFSLPEFYEDNLLPKTKELVHQIRPNTKFKFALKPKNLKLEIDQYRARSKGYTQRKKAIARVDYFCHWIVDDFEYIKSKIELNAKHLDFIYGTINEVIGNHYEKSYDTKSRDIIVGNSANETNNHLEMLDRLHECSPTDRKIIVPLSYAGISDEYVNAIINKGELCFKDKFVPLIEFMNKEEYHSLLNSCEFVFMNHLRSQAGAVNRFIMYMGKKLFMNEKSNMYQFYKSIGLIVFSIEEEVVPENESLWVSLTQEEKQHNRKILEKVFGKQAVRNRYKQILRIIECQ